MLKFLHGNQIEEKCNETLFLWNMQKKVNKNKQWTENEQCHFYFFFFFEFRQVHFSGMENLFGWNQNTALVFLTRILKQVKSAFKNSLITQNK